jgi:uncharacterized protein YacL
MGALLQEFVDFLDHVIEVMDWCDVLFVSCGLGLGVVASLFWFRFLDSMEEWPTDIWVTAFILWAIISGTCFRLGIYFKDQKKPLDRDAIVKSTEGHEKHKRGSHG